jgi:hypothetical protein
VSYSSALAIAPTNVKVFGAKGDGTTDDSTAIKDALNFMFSGSDYKQNRDLYFPAGNYLVTSNNVMGQWSSSPAYRQHVTFIGAGRYSSAITFKPGGSTAKYLYDGESGGVGIAQQLLFVLFEKLGFICDDTGMSGGSVNLFKEFPVVGAPTQNFMFRDCYFQGATTYPGTVLEVRGITNGSENSFHNCRANGMQHIIYSTNPQNVNNYAFGCDWEGCTSDIYYFSGGGQLTHVGGSVVWTPASAAYVLNSDAPAGGLTTNYNVYGLKVESNTASARLVNVAGANNSSRIAFRDCDFGVTAGGDRTSVSVLPDSTASVLFDHCRFVGQSGEHLMEFKAAITANYQFSTHANAQIELRNCWILRTMQDNVTWGANALGLFRIRDAQQTGGSATGQSGVAMDCDMTNLGQVHPRSSNGAAVKSHTGYTTYWPDATFNTDGADAAVKLPVNSMVKSIKVRKVASSGSATTYRLAVINSDGTYTYGITTAAAQNTQHDFTDAAVWRKAASGVNQTIRVVTVKELAYNTQTVNFTLGATLTDGGTGATAKILADADAGATGTLTLGLITGAFGVGNLITDSSGGSATAGATTSRQGSADAQTMAAGDIYCIEYL